MKHYYIDPLAAAWMAKHFGMKFTDSAGISVSANPVMWYMSQCHYKAEHPLYIHLASLHILEAQVGDLIDIRCSKKNAKFYSKYFLTGGYSMPPGTFYHILLENKKDRDWYTEEWFWDEHPELHGKIIQRNGIAFHWPEVADA